jgi:chromosome partitioning protein
MESDFMKRIVIADEKGGVGKTTLATHIAAGLAQIGKKVLLIDADSQGHATIICGHEKQPCFYDLLVRNAPWADVMRLVSPEVYELPLLQGSGTLYVVPSNSETGNIPNNSGDMLRLKHRMRELETIFDVVVFDTSPQRTYLHNAIFLAADAVLIPVRLDPLSFDGLVETIGNMQRSYDMRDQLGISPLSFSGIVPTAYNPRYKEEQYNLEELQASYGDLVWEPIAFSALWSRAYREGRMIYGIAPQAKPTHQITKLTARVLSEVIYAS